MPVRANNPRVATNGSGFLAVWLDMRANGNVYATRLDKSGKVLDPTDIPLLDTAGLPAVASDGTNYLVAISSNDISAVRVAADGTVGERKHIGSSGNVSSTVDIASNGDNYLAVWLPGFAAILDADGNTIAGPFRIDGIKNFEHIVVASNGHDYLVAGVSDDVLFPVLAIPVTSRGVVGTPQQLFTSHLSDIAIASNGSDYLIASARDNSVRMMYVGADGTPIGSELDQISSGEVFTPRVAWNGSQYVIGYIESGQLQTALRFVGITPFFGTLQAGASVGSMTVDSFAAPFDLVGSGEFLVVWSGANGTYVTVASAADLTFQHELSGSILASAPAEQFSPQIISNGPTTIAVWREGYSELKGALLASDGSPLSDPLDIGSASGPGDYHMAFAGTTFLVTWIDNGDLYARRFTSTLQPIDLNPLLVQQNVASTSFALAASDKAALVAWSAPNPPGFYENDVFGALIQTDGASMTATPISIAVFPFDDSDPSVSWNGKEFLVAWAHALAPTPTVLSPVPPYVPTEIAAIRISPAGQLWDSTPIVVETGLGGRTTTATASNGRDFFVAWGDSTGIVGTLVSTNGAVAGSVTEVSSDPASVFSMSLAPDGAAYIALWSTQVSYQTTIYFRVIGNNGGTSAIMSLPVIERVPSVGGPSLALTPAGILIAYDRVATEPQFAGVSRVFTRTVLSPPSRRRPIALR